MVVFSFPYSKGFCSYNFGYFFETLYMAALSGLHCPIDIKDGYFDDFETGFFFSHDYWLDVRNDEPANPGLQIIRYTPYQSWSSPWFDLRVFYVRISNFEVDDSTPEYLTLNHIPLSPDTLLEVNGTRSSIFSDGVSSLLRRDRVDKKSEEATFVSTDSIRLTGSVKFEVFDKEDLILSGALEISNSNGFIGESKTNAKQWSMNCESEITAGTAFLKGKQIVGSELPPPTIEVYVAGCFSGTPIILTKTLQLSFRKKHNRKGALDSIPEYETTECQKNVPSSLDLQAGVAKQSLHIVMLWAVLQGYGDVANSMFNSSFVMAAHMLPLLKHVSCYKKGPFLFNDGCLDRQTESYPHCVMGNMTLGLNSEPYGGLPAYVGPTL
ncbi:Uncharacterized protein CK203_007923 [Vitis vinifera]|uniref:Erythronate-4-phosphate dehydrogenase family protein n=1 Tax=Vitis vinifera TaxID=29760 RepID=A0A438K1B4_VITVI|nr:Uncharacterized protein CK203_007923 [Vitis vinifera]